MSVRLSGSDSKTSSPRLKFDLCGLQIDSPDKYLASTGIWGQHLPHLAAWKHINIWDKDGALSLYRDQQLLANWLSTRLIV